MSNVTMIKLSSLGLEEGLVVIKKTLDAVYEIDTEANIVVKSGVFAKFVDSLEGNNVNMCVEKDASIKYLAIDSINSTRTFDVFGELNMTEVFLKETKETLRVNLKCENANSSIQCLSLASSMKNRFVQYVSHEQAQTTSVIKNVGVAMNASEIIFDTTGKIEKKMAKSKCSQLSRGIVMDDVSVITAKPILLIDEYDCFANHGASIGKMSDEDMFYLMSRGLSKKDAFLLILKGIIHPFMESIEIDEIKDNLEKEVSNLIEK